MAGKIQEKKIQRLGETDYTYPLISVKEIHLWPVEKKKQGLLFLLLTGIALTRIADNMGQRSCYQDSLCQLLLYMDQSRLLKFSAGEKQLTLSSESKCRQREALNQAWFQILSRY